MNQEIEKGVQSVRKFAIDSYRFLQVCEKPDVVGNPCLKQNSKKSLNHAHQDSPSWAASDTSSSSSSSQLTTSSLADCFIHIYNFSILLLVVFGLDLRKIPLIYQKLPILTKITARLKSTFANKPKIKKYQQKMRCAKLYLFSTSNPKIPFCFLFRNLKSNRSKHKLLQHRLPSTSITVNIDFCEFDDACFKNGVKQGKIEINLC